MALTKAQLMREISAIGELVSGEMRELSEGVWNPDFCASAGDGWAKSFCAELRVALEHLESQINADYANNDDGPTADDVRGILPGPS